MKNDKMVRGGSVCYSDIWWLSLMTVTTNVSEKSYMDRAKNNILENKML